MSKPVKIGVIGYPVKHSQSPFIHNGWLQAHGIDGAYEAIEILPENLEKDVRNLIAGGYRGFNVTIPHKEKIIALCDTIEPVARHIGAVNTVVIENGKLRGTNTDYFGFLENIREQHSDFRFSDGAAVILGAGGAARAVLYSLISENVPEIKIVNRTRQKAENLANAFKDIAQGKIHIKVMDWNQRHLILENSSLVVNTTALGMTGKLPLDIDLSHLPVDALVSDIVYVPLKTSLLEKAQKRGNRIATGLGMLLHQARPAFHLWTGVMPDVSKEMAETIEKRVSGE